MSVFENLSGKLQETLKKIKGQSRITDKDVKEMMREIRLALLEADVNYKVAKDFIAKVSEKSIGEQVLESLSPGQQVVSIVHNQLIELLGGTPAKVTFASKPPTIFMLVGLNGAGKTTTCAKIAGYYKKQGKNPLLAACDIYRPAAIKQLQVIGGQLGIPVFTEPGSDKPVHIAKKSIEYANVNQYDMVILDTAGRLHINEELMEELRQIKAVVKPHEILLVIDSMTGQDAVNAASSFNESLGIDGVILTKLDGDTRGGAALSVKAVTGKPIKFTGTGEKLNDLEPFYPDRMASRILGMGDVLSLIEKAQEAFDEKKAIELEKKMRTQQFTLDDFMDQMQQIKKMGPLNQIVSMIPGFDSKALQNTDIDENKLSRIEAIIKSMTRQERNDPAIINSSRRIRISKGSGTAVQDVNKLLKDFHEMKKLMKNMSEMSKHGMKNMGRMKFPFN